MIHQKKKTLHPPLTVVEKRFLNEQTSDLISLRAGEEASEGAAAGRQSGCERRAAVSQDGLQVAEEEAQVKGILHQ